MLVHESSQEGKLSVLTGRARMLLYETCALAYPPRVTMRLFILLVDLSLSGRRIARAPRRTF